MANAQTARRAQGKESSEYPAKPYGIVRHLMPFASYPRFIATDGSQSK